MGTVSKAIRSVEKALTGEDPPTDILDRLEDEHREVAALLQSLVESESGAARKSLLKKVVGALVPHARAEQKVLYDALIRLRKRGVQKDGQEGYLEHELALTVIKKLRKMQSAMSPEFGAAAKVLKELITHHVKEEESSLWSDTKKYFSKEQRQEMDREYLRVKKAIRVD
jgi:hemerythrin-like domain-containing protein